MKACIDPLVLVISRILNLSPTKCTFLSHYKTAIVKPLIKKPNLGKVLKNYRQVLSLSFVSKLIEEAVCRQLPDYMVKYK